MSLLPPRGKKIQSRQSSTDERDWLSGAPEFHYTPAALLGNPFFNKGCAYTPEERKRFRLRGLIPPLVESLDTQILRAKEQLAQFTKPINRYIFLNSLQRTNVTLFYALLLDDLEALLPIVYTPTVGEACQTFAHLFRGTQGMYIDAEEDRGDIYDILKNWPLDDVDIIVVTDGSRILGLGDLGVNGMGIPIGKLSLYVAAAGLHPARTLPITIDMGTNNEGNLADSLYIGSRHKRVPEEEFLGVMDEFMAAVHKRWPRCLVQFEDFSTEHAFELLEKHRNNYLCFNDDIQGTAAVILAGFISATRQIGMSFKDHRLVFFGAGSAGVGIAELIVAFLVRQGMTDEEARSRFWLVDSKGLITDNRGDKLQAHKVPFARHDVTEQKTSLLAVVEAVRPTCLFGLSTTPGTFTKEICECMAEYNEHPMIFPLSNPTSKAECTAEQAYTWTNGKCIFAAGSPFDPVTLGDRTFYPGQGNNLYIFPGLGLGSIVIKARKVTDTMIMAAADTLADQVTDEEKAMGLVYPSLKRIRSISKAIAVAVAKTAMQEGVADAYDGDLDTLMAENMYVPGYEPTQAAV
eukprot:comp23611_c0_seq1/m.40162 comp23611_c0_seq1/g.40162  ORF comp23611_c0_seq1/g.40162 comp23611_c0_seq1/m.40162 type:complete len:576 (-) comp23611_c0_seq1:392-2119(-)